MESNGIEARGVTGGVDWDARYRDGDTPWDKGRPHPGLDGFREVSALRGRGLVPGCGTGWDARYLAERLGEAATVVGLDLSERALAVARGRDPARLVDWRRGDLMAPATFADLGPFDWVFEHTCFCAIPPEMRVAYVDVFKKQIRPGGLLLGFFFTGLPDDGNGPPWGIDPGALESLFRDGFDSVAVYPSLTTFPGREGEETFRVWRRTRKA